MSNFDVAVMALQSSGLADNDLLFDAVNMPSVMVWIPRFSWKDIGLGDSTDPFPAFIVNGKTIDGFWFSKYMNISQNGKAYSIPAQDFGNSLTFDAFNSRCTTKGAGWHMTTRLEWMAVALWSLRNGTLPKGNNDYGKDSTETTYKAIPTQKNSQGKTTHVATGTGPLTWSHTHTPDGIWDLNGNGNEFVGGVRLVKGELQVISVHGAFGNDAADLNNSQAADSALWHAIDGTTGDLITPDGNGTTINSLKVDKVSGKMTWITGTLSSAGQMNGSLESVNLASTVCEAAKRILQALGFYKPDGISAGDLGGDYVYFANNISEVVFRCGGYSELGSKTGAFFAIGYHNRDNVSTNTGFRASFCDIPAGEVVGDG